MFVRLLWVLFITQTQLRYSWHVLCCIICPFNSSRTLTLWLCVLKLFYFIVLYSHAALCFMALSQGIIGKWWLYFCLWTFNYGLLRAYIFFSFYLYSSLSIFLFSCLFYFDWLVCLLQFLKQKSLIYYTFPLEAMFVGVGCIFPEAECLFHTEAIVSVSSVLVTMANFLSPPGRLRCLFGHPKQQPTITWCI